MKIKIKEPYKSKLDKANGKMSFNYLGTQVTLRKHQVIDEWRKWASPTSPIKHIYEDLKILQKNISKLNKVKAKKNPVKIDMKNVKRGDAFKLSSKLQKFMTEQRRKINKVAKRFQENLNAEQARLESLAAQQAEIKKLKAELEKSKKANTSKPANSRTKKTKEEVSDPPK